MKENFDEEYKKSVDFYQYHIIKNQFMKYNNIS